jgi:hypothetical protein
LLPGARRFDIRWFPVFAGENSDRRYFQFEQEMKITPSVAKVNS